MLMTVVALLAAAPTWAALDEAGREAAIAALKDEPMPGRVARAAEGFLGTRYQVSPLGEGTGRDFDPLVRFDAVDCLTLVEQAPRAVGDPHCRRADWPAQPASLFGRALVGHPQPRDGGAVAAGEPSARAGCAT
jgi:hypothetical protein